MEWTEEHDNYLRQEILVLEPFEYKKVNISRGKIRVKLQTIWMALSFPDSNSISMLLEKDTHCWVLPKFWIYILKNNISKGLCFADERK